MKIHFLFFTFFFIACGSNIEQNQNLQSSTEIIQNEIKSALTSDTLVEPYSESFSKEFFQREDFKDAVIKDDLILLSPNDSIHFPEQPPLNESIRLVGVNDNIRINLSIKRINYTSISYIVEIAKKGQSSCQIEGKADLGIYFFLGDESDTNELNGESYLSTEFTDSKENCTNRFRIGQSEPGENGKYLAKIIVDCAEKCASIDLDNCPILIEQ